MFGVALDWLASDVLHASAPGSRDLNAAAQQKGAAWEL